MVDMDESAILSLLEELPPVRFQDEDSPWFPYFTQAFKVSGCADSWDDCFENTLKSDYKQDILVAVNGLEINPESRFKLLSWLFDVSLELKLELSVYMYACKLLDVYCKKKFVTLAFYQAHGLVCLWISDKYLSQLPNPVENYHYFFTAIHDINEREYFPSTECKILSAIDWSPGMVTTLSYFPDPEFKPDPMYVLSMNDFKLFQECCRWVCCIVNLDMNLCFAYNCYDLAVCVYLLVSQTNPSIKVDLEDRSVIAVWRKMLLNNLIDSIHKVLINKEHPLTAHLHLLSVDNFFISRVLLLFRAYNKASAKI